MSLDENKALIRQLFERVVNDQELELADQTVAPEYVDHSARPDHARGPESIRNFVGRQRAAYPDAHVTIEDIMAEDDRVAVRICMTGTPTAGGPPVRFRGSVWWRLADGKIVERWGGAFAREEIG
jgi:predicted SnoaL-like aldol condensation-catalyzing enzyme